MNQHTIHTLYKAMQNDLAACHTAFEQSMVKAIGGKEIRKLAQSLMTQGKLTASESSIAQQFGFRA